MGYLEDNGFVEEPETLDDMRYQNTLMSKGDRDTTLDYLSAAFRGFGTAINMSGASLQQMGAEDAGQVVRDAGSSMLESEFAKPDPAEFFGKEGLLKRGTMVAVESTAASTAPLLSGIAGSAVGSPLVGAGAAGVTGFLQYGLGGKKIAFENITKEKPDMPLEEREEYSWRVGMNEAIPEMLGDMISIASGGILAEGKPVLSAGFKALFNSGELTAKEAVATAFKGASPAAIAKVTGFNAGISTGTETVTELLNRANRESYELPAQNMDFPTLLVAAAFPGPVGTAAGYVGGRLKIASIKKGVEDALSSGDIETRLATSELLSNRISEIDPEFGQKFKETIVPLAIEGPVSLETVINKRTTIDEVIDTPEKVMESSGIPLGGSELRTTNRAEEFKKEEEARIATEEAQKLTVESRLAPFKAKQETSISITDGIAKEEAQRRMASISAKVEDYMKTVEPDTSLLTRLDAATGKVVPATIAEASVPLYDALILDNARSQAIKEGMQRVLVDSNKLAEITDLDEREVLQNRIQKTQKQIVKEVTAHTKEKGKAVVAPVEQKISKVAPPIAELPKLRDEDIARAQMEAGVTKTSTVAPTAKVEAEDTTTPLEAEKNVEVAKSAPRVVPEGKTYKEQLLVTQKLEEDLARAQTAAKSGKPEEATAAKELSSILAEDVQVSRKRLQSMPKPGIEPIVFKNKKEAQEAARLGAPEKMGESEVAIALGLQDRGVDVTPAIRLILGKQKKLGKQDLEDPVKVKEAVDTIAKVLETPQQIKATGVGEGRSIEFHDGTKLIYMGASLEAPKRWMVKQGPLTKRVSSEPLGRKAIAEGTVKDLKDYADEGRKDVLAKDMPKLTQEQKDLVTKFIKNEKYEAYGPSGDVALAASLLAADGKLYENGKLNVKGLKSKTKSITDTITRKSSESMSAGQAGVTSGVTEKLELSTEEDIVLPAEKPVRTKAEVAAERKAKREALESTVVKVEATEDLKAQILARHKEAMAKKKASGATLESELGVAGAKRVRDKQETTLREDDNALYDVSDRLRWKKNREPQLTDEFINTVIDGYLAPVNYNPLEAILRFSKEYPNPRTQDLIDTQMFLVSSLMAEKTVMKNYFTNNYRNALELLDGVIANGGKEAKALAEFIRESPKIKELENIPVSVSDGVSFFTARDDGSISIRSNGMMDVNVWLHEVQHAATSREILSNEKMREEVKVMMRNLENNSGLSKDQLKAVEAAKGSSSKFNEIAKDYSVFTDAQMNIAYSLVNEREFLAQIYSSSAVRDLARRTRHTAGSFRDSVWKRIKQFFSDVMKLPKEYDSVLEAALRVSERLYRVNYKTGLSFTDMSLETESRRNETPDEAVRKILAERKQESVLKGKLEEKMSQALESFKKLAVPISDSLKRISEPIYAKLIEMEAIQNFKGAKYSKGISPFLSYYKGLTVSQKVRLDYGLMNNHEDVWNEMPRNVRAELENVLGDIGDRGIAVGYLTKKKPRYYPRRVKDIEGLIEHLTKGMDEKGPIAVALKAKADSVGMQVSELPRAMRNQVITDMLSSGEIMQLPKPGSVKKRSIGKVTSDLVPFYMNSSDALIAHVYESNDKLSMKEFVGASGRKKKIKDLMSLNTKIDKETDETKRALLLQKWEEDAKALSDLEEDLEGGIQELIDKELSTEPKAKQVEVFSMLSARMRQKGASGIYDTFRNIGYIATMGNMLSAITQLGDIPIIFYSYGINRETVAAAGKAFKNVATIARGELTGKSIQSDAFVFDMDFQNSLREFTSGNKLSAKALETVFKYSGLKYMDLVGKEARMQAAYSYYQKPKNREEFIEKYKYFFENPEEILQKIQLGNKRDKDVLTVLFTELSDFQPISLSQQSEVYLGSANARMFFALKTFTLRTTSAAIREGLVEIKKGGPKDIARGAMKITAILALYAAAGAGTDELKDLITGKESGFKDNTIDNLMQLFFISKYTVEQGMQRDQLLQGLLEDLIPPVRYADQLIGDINGLVSSEKDFEFKSLSWMLPVIGSTLQRRSDPQQAKYAEQYRTDILEDVKKNAKKRRGAYYGGITERVREYNKKVVDKEKRIDSSVIMNAYKRE